jgi:uncharacterized protein
MADMWWCLLAVVIFGPVACTAGDDVPDRPPSEVTFEGSDAVLYVEVADDADERRRGLMGVHHLPDDQGMAFVWDEPVSSTFWMKDTLIPLSIAFVDDEGHVVDLVDMQPCTSDACRTYRSDEPYVMAVEANAGWFEEHGIREGDRAGLEVMANQ